MSYKLAVENLINKIGFVEKEVYKKDFKNEVCLLSGEITGKNVVLKIFSAKNERRIVGTQKEFLVDRLIDNYNKNSSDKIKKTDIITLDHNDEIVWVIREYIFGESLCGTQFDPSYLITPDKLSTIRDKFLLNRQSIVQNTAKRLLSLQKITGDKKSFDKQFKENIKDCPISEIEAGLGISLDEQLCFFKKNSKCFYSADRQVACMGDITPANVIIRGLDDALLTDFEWFCYDNLFIDIAHFWLFLWRYPDCQDVWISNFIKSEDDKRDFHLSVIRILINMMGKVFIDSSNTRDNIAEIRQAYKKHIWRRYLEAAGTSYDKILITK